LGEADATTTGVLVDGVTDGDGDPVEVGLSVGKVVGVTVGDGLSVGVTVGVLVGDGLSVGPGVPQFIVPSMRGYNQTPLASCAPYEYDSCAPSTKLSDTGWPKVTPDKFSPAGALVFSSNTMKYVAGEPATSLYAVNVSVGTGVQLSLATTWPRGPSADAVFVKNTPLITVMTATSVAILSFDFALMSTPVVRTQTRGVTVQLLYLESNF
jgi:hypothetical protein